MTIEVHLGSGECGEACQPLITRTFEQLNTPTYSKGASLLPIDWDFAAWRAEHRTARKRADRARRLSYTFATVDWSQHSDDIHDINTSLPERQGRPMTAGYRERKEHGLLPPQPCDRHRVHTFGVLRDDRLRAYLSLYRVGELAHVSMLLGHGDHLRNDVMYLLLAGAIEQQASHGGFMFYNRHDSGTDGLRFFKERLGFQPADIIWVR